MTFARATALVLAAIVGWPAAASATYPGENGEILYLGAAGLERLDPSTGESALVTSRILGYAGVAADGETIAYARPVPQTDSGGPGSTIYVAGLHGGPEREVSYREFSPVHEIAISPDAGTIGYGGESTGPGLSAIGSDGANLRSLTAMPNDQQLEFSPDGTKIVFQRFGAQLCGSYAQWASSIWIANADGSGARPLIRTPSQVAMEPAFEVNGRRIVYVRSHGRATCDEEDNVARLAVHSVRLDGRGDRLVTKPSHRSLRIPLPSPDGERLLLMGDRRLMTMPINGRGKTVPVPGSRAVGTPLAWAPAP